MGLPSQRGPSGRTTAAALGLALGVGFLGCGSRGAAVPHSHSGDVHAATLESCALTEERVDAAWSQYRRHRPFHAQEVAASEPDEKGCRAILLSEPPPGSTDGSFGDVHPALARLKTKRHPIGVDGFVEDFVGVLPAMSDDELAEVTSRLHVSLFGTAYRARLAPIGPAPRWRGPLDVEVRPGELHPWIFGPDASFWPLDGGARERASDLFEPSQTGVYVSSTPGIVLWSFPKKGDFAEQRANVRIFGVESDLVLGALADDDTVVVIGRERVAPVDVLPPLRFESVQILARTPLHQLAQSYERTQLFAGTLSTGKDWAPILLSPAIVDTEVGSVLNIADQLLKRWSMAKKIDYERFAYPDEPPAGPFSKPISDELQSDVVTFNWNTARTGALSTLDDGKALYWMHRTGALNVSYLPDEKPDPRTASYEDTARDYFARQADAHLVRTVQHTALFQAFRQLGVSSEDRIADMEDMIGPDAAVDTLISAAAEALGKLATMPDSELGAAATRFADRELGAIETPTEAQIQRLLARASKDQRAALEPQIREKIHEVWADHARKLKAARAAEIVKNARALRKAISSATSPDAARHVGMSLAYEPLARASAQDAAQWSQLVAQLRRADARQRALEIEAAGTFVKKHGLDRFPHAEWKEVLAAVSDLDAVQVRFSQARNQRETRTHVRTPSVVRSQSLLVGAQGGHNVGSGVSRATSPLKPANLGRLTVSRTGVSLAPTPVAARSRDAALLSVPTRPAPAKIALGSPPPPPNVPDSGWARLSEEPSFGCGPGCVVIRRYESASPSAVPTNPLRPRFQVDIDGTVGRAGSTMDITDQVVRSLDRQARRGKPKAVRVSFVLRDLDMTPDEAMAVADSTRAALARRHLDLKLDFVVDRQNGAALDASFDLAGATVSGPAKVGDTYVISVAVPRKKGALLRLFSRSEPAAELRDGSSLPQGARTPRDLARELGERFGPDLLLELAGDAQSVNTENDIEIERSRHAGTPGSAL